MSTEKTDNLRFYQLLETHLNNKVKKFENELLTPVLMREIRESIRSAITDVFEKSTNRLSINGITWLTDRYFKSIKINGDQLMSDQVVINEYMLSELDLYDIHLLRKLFGPTVLGNELNAEYLRRNVS